MFATTATTAAAPVASDLIKAGSEASFMKDVIETSQTTPVIVDFWAPWCGPCKTLGPALEAAVTAQKGRVRMVKIDVDQNPAISAQLRIQSIPTVYAFFKGQPVDGFQGAISGSEIKKFVETVAAMGPEADGGLAEALEAAEAMLTEGAAADAAETFAAILGEEPENPTAYAGLVRSHLAIGDIDQAEAFANAAPPPVAKSREMDAARAQIALARQSAAAGPEVELRAALARDPKNPQLMFDTALALQANDKLDEAVDLLLNLVRLDQSWNDGAAKTQLFTLFGALKPQDPLVLNGRRRLSSILFA